MEDGIDGILSRDHEIVPSNGFAARVMQAVRRETSEPPPIAFPWRRALPGLSAAAVALVTLLAFSGTGATGHRGTDALGTIHRREGRGQCWEPLRCQVDSSGASRSRSLHNAVSMAYSKAGGGATARFASAQLQHLPR
jgi:hypothetical protein